MQPPKKRRMGLPGLSVYRPFTIFAIVEGVTWNGVDWASKSKAEKRRKTGYKNDVAVTVKVSPPITISPKGGRVNKCKKRTAQEDKLKSLYTKDFFFNQMQQSTI